MNARRMTEQAFFVLTALTAGPCHGYGIMQEVDGLSDGRVELKVGTLYGVLDRLVEGELVEPDRDEVHDGRLRRYYTITEMGEQALWRESQRHAANARVAGDRLRALRPSWDVGGA